MAAPDGAPVADPAAAGPAPSDYTAEGGHGAVPTHAVPARDPGAHSERAWPLWEVFVRARRGLSHNHVGSLHASDAEMALRMARDVYTRRSEGVSLWVVPTRAIIASSPEEKDPFFSPAGDKAYRHPTFYEVPEGVRHL